MDICDCCKRYVLNMAATEVSDALPCETELFFNCRICCGLFDNTFVCNITDDVNRILHDANYDCSSFRLALSLPTSLFIRETIVRFLHAHDDAGRLLALDFANNNSNLKRSWRDFFINRLETLLKLPFNKSSDFTIEVQLEYVNEKEEFFGFLKHFEELNDKDTNFNSRQTQHSLRNKISLNRLQAVLAKLSELQLESLVSFVERYKLPPHISKSVLFKHEINFLRDYLIFGGRYCKYSRYLSQTPWFVDGCRRGQTSIEELISEPLKIVSFASNYTFMSSGREDIDVRMLGSGRPFAVQLTNAKKTIFTDSDIKAIMNQINQSSSDISISNLKIVSNQELQLLKASEEVKQKRYTALCYSADRIDIASIQKLNTMRNLEILQKTPLRVLHRRSLIMRKKIIYEMQATLLNPFSLMIQIDSQAGTYIKEFVNGDFGRTEPSLRDLLQNFSLDIVELDVEHVSFDWPSM